MDIYIIIGKWPYSRCGMDDYVDQRIVYIPHKEMKFCVDDRDVRPLFNKEKMDLERMIGKLNNSKSDSDTGHTLKSKATIFIFKRKIDEPIFEEISKAYQDKNRKFFFKNTLFQKS